ncbi:MAG: polyhydroxyalkanoic acid system family protein [Pseudomonadota bacterium]
MADIHIERTHRLGLHAARETARRWAAEAEEKYAMQCAYTEADPGTPDGCDELSFKRPGVNGTLTVSASRFDVRASLGFLLGAFQPQIVQQIEKKLDALLNSKTTSPASKARKS